MAKSPNRTTAPTGQIAPFGLRMLPDLREEIEAAAKASGRSMNAEIVARLQQSFEEAPPFNPELVHKMAIDKLKSELLGHLLAEAGETIAAAREATGVLKAAGKWPVKPAAKSRG